jgi:hypothetical protein
VENDMGLLALLGEFFGRILREILPGLLKIGRRQRTTRVLGVDEDLQDDINRSIEKQASSSRRDPDSIDWL